MANEKKPIVIVQISNEEIQAKIVDAEKVKEALKIEFAKLDGKIDLLREMQDGKLGKLSAVEG